MKLLTTLGIIAAFGMVAACSSSDDDGGTGGTTGTGATGGKGGSGGSGGSGGTGGGATGGSAGSSTGGSAGSATGGAAGTTGDGGLDCSGCIQANCTAELGACAADAECLKIVTCAAACTDQPCIDACVTANPNGKPKWDEVEKCGNDKCAVECA